MGIKSSGKNFFSLLKIFIIFQPILDILTTISIYYIDISITIGIVIRVLFMIISLFFIFFGNKSYYKKPIIIYLLTVFTTIGTGFIINYFNKPIFNIFVETQFAAKTAYFAIMLGSFLLIFDRKEDQQRNTFQLYKYIYIALTIVSLSVFVAVITGTSISSYEWLKQGFQGWFFSANELSAIVAISFPLVYLYTLRKTTTFRHIFIWIPTLMIAILSTVIGTKVGFFAIVLTSFIMFCILLLNWLITRKQTTIIEKTLSIKLLFSGILLVILLSISPLTPGYYNLSVDAPPPNQEDIDSGYDFDESDPDADPNGNESAKSNRYELIELTNPLLNKILSSRQIYFTWQYNQIIRADTSQKLFGMGFAGNYTNNQKTIEMDFFDIFFSYGIIGSLIILFPLLYLTLIVIKHVFTNFKNVIMIENVGLSISILLGLGIAFIAGHVWFAPAVNLYLAISMVILYTNLEFKSTTNIS